MLSALLITALAASGAGVSLGGAVNVSAADAEAVLVQLDAALRTAGLEPRRVAGGCKGDRQCVAKQASGEGLKAIVTVAIAGSKRGLAIDLEAVAADGTSIAQLTDRFGAVSDARMPDVFAEHARKVLEATRPSDTPARVVEKAETPAPPVRVVAAPVERSGPPRWLFAATAVVSVAAIASAIAFGAQGFQLKGAAEGVGADGRALHSEVHSQRLVDDANARLTTSLALGITAGVFAVVAVALGIASF
ncbi:MAG: hypothetical protein JNK82_09460 [Myxococcaceae bacterium]|nr:hypothetical protein [Myxococcaceae bacterium]